MMTTRPWHAVLAVLPFALACDPDPQHETPETARRSSAIVTDCDYLNPALHPPLPTPVDYGHELMITDLSVVEDPCRTTYSPTVPCATGTVGVWTFNELMFRMKGTRPLHPFVQEWLHTFEITTFVNGFPVPPLPNARPAFIDPWLVASGCRPGAPLIGPRACKLDMKNAPFRLLAIVNRNDLSGPGMGMPDMGEGRFVFGLVNALSGAPLQSTVIFEFKLPPPRDAHQWAVEWNQLSSMPLGSVPYRDHLQHVTDEFTLPGLMPGAPNLDSPIGQVRTNDLEMGTVWDLREFTLQDIGLGINQYGLLNHEMHQTPDDTWNFDPALDAYMVADEPAILNVSHTVPNMMLGGHSTATFVWNNGGTAGGFDPMARHLFGFATCNGCHLDETATPFTHVSPRPAGAPAPLSGFMSAPTTPMGGPNGLPSGFFSVPDPTGAIGPFQYNEPWRRMCEASRILHGDPTPYTKANGAH